jgi:predicted nucleic acid binding AN1-type Zn finger protein
VTECAICDKHIEKVVENANGAKIVTGGLKEFNNVRTVSLPFDCLKCGGVFCEKHRLPENHECGKPIPLREIVCVYDASKNQKSFADWLKRAMRL